MADITKTNVLLNFAHGQEANLPTTHTQGTIYITTDTKRMYVDLPGANDRLCLSNFELITSLDSNGAPSITRAKGEANTFYVTKDANGNYALWMYHGTDGFKKIVNTSELNAAITALGNRVTALETWKGSFESGVAATYLKLDGSNSPMTGDLAMGSGTDATKYHKITNLATPTANNDAANKKYVDDGLSGKAPTSHASTATTYGQGTTSNYGHVKLSDAVDKDTAAASGGTAATPKAVKAAYDKAVEAYNKAEAIDLSPYVKHDGTVAMTGDLSFGGKKITNLATPVAATDAATKGYIDGIIGNDTTDNSISKRIADIEDSLGEPATTGNAAGTAYERIQKNVEDIAGLGSALSTFKDTTAPATYLKLDGSNSPMTGNLAMGSKKITGLADGAAASDAATVGNVTSAVSAHNDNKGSGTAFGHVKLSDATDSDSGASANIAATPLAVKNTMVAATAAQSTANEALGKANAALPSANLPGILADYMPKAGGEFSGNVSFASGKTLTVNTPTVNGHAATKKYVDDAVTGINSNLGDLEERIKNVTNIMNFVGTTTTEIKDDGTTKTINKPSTVASDKTYTAEVGDVVIDAKGKECVYDGSAWRWIGDTTAQDAAITALQNTVGSKPTGEGVPDMDDKLWDEVTDLRTDLGEKGDAKDSDGSAFARIADLADKVSGLDSEMNIVVNQLVWGTF